MYRLLIVEDDKGIAEAIKTQAEMWDFSVRIAENFRNVMADFADFDPHMGADDFISKPFDQSVLTAKLRALMRRSYDFAASAPVLEHKGALLNTGDNTLSYGDEKISFSKNEYRILLVLMENRGKVVSREKLIESLWETDSFIDENTLSVNVNRLRKRLESIGLNGFITTKFGVGYIIED